MKKILVWVAVGVAMKYFLDSDKGEEVKSYVKDLLGDAKDAFNEYYQKASETVEGAITRTDKKLIL